MGLDQIAYFKENGGEIDGKPQEVQVDIATWRKHPNLQGYMEALWRSRGGKGEFNCVSVELSWQDVHDLASTIIQEKLPETTGFFYGGNADKHYRLQDLEFCVKALGYINEGNKVYYSSWW